MISRDCSEYDIPSVPILIPSLTPIVLNLRKYVTKVEWEIIVELSNLYPISPAGFMPSFTEAERSKRCILQGFPSNHTEQIPTFNKGNVNSSVRYFVE